MALACLRVLAGVASAPPWCPAPVESDYVARDVQFENGEQAPEVRHRVWRKLLVDAIVADPTWQGSDSTEPPRAMASALGFLLLATSVPLQWQQQFPSRAAADANHTIYHFRASEDFDPSSRLGEITASLLAFNSADDFVNPPELLMMQALFGRVGHGRFVLIPISDETRGPGTHSLPQVCGPHLAEFLQSLPR